MNNNHKYEHSGVTWAIRVRNTKEFEIHNTSPVIRNHRDYTIRAVARLSEGTWYLAGGIDADRPAPPSVQRRTGFGNTAMVRASERVRTELTFLVDDVVQSWVQGQGKIVMVMKARDDELLHQKFLAKRIKEWRATERMAAHQRKLAARALLASMRGSPDDKEYAKAIRDTPPFNIPREFYLDKDADSVVSAQQDWPCRELNVGGTRCRAICAEVSRGHEHCSDAARD